MSDFVSFILCVLVRSVMAMSTGDPAEDFKNLLTDAQDIERNIYESANIKVGT